MKLLMGHFRARAQMIRVGAWTEIIKIVLDKWRKMCYTIYVKGDGLKFKDVHSPQK